MDIIGRHCCKWRLRVWLKLLWHTPLVDVIVDSVLGGDWLKLLWHSPLVDIIVDSVLGGDGLLERESERPGTEVCEDVEWMPEE